MYVKKNERTYGSRVGSELPPVVCLEGVRFLTCIIWIASMHISRPVLRRLRETILWEKSSVDIQHISLCSTTRCEGLICAAKVMVCTRDPPLWRTLEWWDVLALDCPTNVQEDKSPVTSEHNVQRSKLFCYDDLLCDIVTVLPCWDLLPFLLFC